MSTVTMFCMFWSGRCARNHSDCENVGNNQRPVIKEKHFTNMPWVLMWLTIISMGTGEKNLESKSRPITYMTYGPSILVLWTSVFSPLQSGNRNIWPIELESDFFLEIPLRDMIDINNRIQFILKTEVNKSSINISTHI